MNVYFRKEYIECIILKNGFKDELINVPFIQDYIKYAYFYLFTDCHCKTCDIIAMNRFEMAVIDQGERFFKKD